MNRDSIAGARRIQTGVSGLDEMLRGGLLDGSATLVEGPPGGGKTTLGLQFLTHGAMHAKEPGLFITFEEFPRELYRDARAFGWDVNALESVDLLRVIFTSPELLLSELEQPGSRLSEEIRTLGVKRVVVDSISQFREVVSDAIGLRQTYRRLVNALKREGVTTLMTSEERLLFGHLTEEAHGLAFLADAIILLRYVEIESGVRRAIVVLKLRGSDHDKEIRQFQIGPGGIQVSSPFRGREGLLSGSPRQSLYDRAVEVFG